MLVLGAALVFFTFKEEKSERRQQGSGLEQKSPVFEVSDLSGKRITSADLLGNVVFVNFWASWCQPCKDEMASIESTFRSAGRNPNFKMVTVLYKDSPQNAVEYMKSQGYTFPVYIDQQGKSASAFGVTGVPETYIIDKRGMLKNRVIGPADWSGPEETLLIKTLLNE